jgi:hypothetical protein
MKHTTKREIIELILGEDKFTKSDIMETLGVWAVILIALTFASLLS